MRKQKFQRSDIPYKDRLLMQKRQNIAEYYEDPEVGESHLKTRLEQLGFLITDDGRMLAAENAETGEIVPIKMLEERNNGENM